MGQTTSTVAHGLTSSPEDDARFRVLHLLQQHPEMSQRQIAKELGIALGRVNFLLKALIDKGMLKASRFHTAQNKWRYAYLLTPRGLAEKAALTAGFLRRKTAEYEALKAEIEALREEAGRRSNAGSGDQPANSIAAASRPTS